MPKTFRLMKAATLETEKDYQRIRYPIYGSPKYDGIRVGCHPELGPVTNTLKGIPNVHIRALLSLARLHGLDGEIIVGSPTDPTGYSDTQSAFSSHGGRSDFSFYVFDDFSSAATQCRFGVRIEDLQVRQSLLRDLPWVRFVEHKQIETREELDAYLDQVGAWGYEGACFRGHDGVYKFGRSTMIEGHLIKYKPFRDAEARITGYELLKRNLNDPVVDSRGLQTRGYSKDGKVEDPNFVGKVIAEVLNGEFIGETIKVGSGLNDDMRQDMVKNWGNYLGKTFTWKYQQFGSKDLPRSPIWKGLRSPMDF